MEVAKLELTSNGKSYSLGVQGGRFSQQLSGLAMTSVINEVKGAEFFLLDEALASADVTSIEEAYPLLDNLVKQGIQVILIEHKEGLYSKLSRREFKVLQLQGDKDDIDPYPYSIIEETLEEGGEGFVE